jgi:hypothetical protein
MIDSGLLTAQLMFAPECPVSVDIVTDGPYLNVSIWKDHLSPPVKPGLPVANNLLFQLFGRNTPVSNDVLVEDATLSWRTQIGKASEGIVESKVIFSPPRVNTPKVLASPINLIVVFAGRVSLKLSAVHARLADTVRA